MDTGQYADSLIDPGNVQSFQKHWIGEVPAEAELTSGDTTTPGVASREHASAALAARENSCFSGDGPGNRGLFHTGCGGGADGKGDFEIFSLTTSIHALGEGNFGRLGPDQQQRYTGRLGVVPQVPGSSPIAGDNTGWGAGRSP